MAEEEDYTASALLDFLGETKVDDFIIVRSHHCHRPNCTNTDGLKKCRGCKFALFCVSLSRIVDLLLHGL